MLTLLSTWRAVDIMTLSLLLKELLEAELPVIEFSLLILVALLKHSEAEERELSSPQHSC